MHSKADQRSEREADKLLKSCLCRIKDRHAKKLTVTDIRSDAKKVSYRHTGSHKDKERDVYGVLWQALKSVRVAAGV